MLLYMNNEKWGIKISACMYLGRAVKNMQLVQFPDITNLRNNIRIKKFVIVSDIP